ncbi:MAG: hypothetical protein ACTH7Q_12535 [Pseudoalteromonas sp.]
MRKLLNTWHKKLGWWGLAALFIWGLSAISHPIMSWFGPQTVAFSAPKLQLNHAQLSGFNQLVKMPSVTASAQVVKVVANEQYGGLLQVTRKGKASRDYYNLETLDYLTDFDKKQAKWLASYYSGIASNKIDTISVIEHFSDDYPAVNRLLPVYKVDFNNGTSTYVFTETNSLASITNGFKNTLKAVFIQLHTFAWLEDIEYGRLVIIGLLMVTLFAMAVTGLGLVFAMRKRAIKQMSRRYHRYLAYALWLPLLGWSASGFYHLLYSSQATSVSGLRLQSIGCINTEQTLNNDWLARYQNKSLTSISVVSDAQNNAVYRLGIAAKKVANANRSSRFKGMPSEAPAVYINPYSGNERNDINDKSQAKLLANKFKKDEQVSVVDSHIVTRYGADYDFRNKRLPVWKVELDDTQSSWLFVDPISGILVDQSRSQDRLERLSFSLLHKWSHLTSFTGRMLRDGMIVITLLLLLVMAGFGAKMMLKKRRAR